MTAAAAQFDVMVPGACVVMQVVKETPDTFTLTVARENGSADNAFAPGQFSMLWVFGVGELPISISGDPSKHEELVYTVRSVGKATHALVSQKPGTEIGVRGPFGNGWPTHAARGHDVVIVAGGIGLAPLRPMIYEVFRNRSEYGRMVILYGAGRPRGMVYV